MNYKRLDQRSRLQSGGQVDNVSGRSQGGLLPLNPAFSAVEGKGLWDHSAETSKAQGRSTADAGLHVLKQ
jgi:hypothetical protein